MAAFVIELKTSMQVLLMLIFSNYVLCHLFSLPLQFQPQLPQKPESAEPSKTGLVSHANQDGTQWPFDVLTAKNGAIYHGLLVLESKESTKFTVVTRKKGRPTVTLTTIFMQNEIASIQRLQENERAILKAKILELDPTGKSESARMNSITLEKTEWIGVANLGKKYVSDHFVLISDGDEEVVRRAAVRLEQLIAALKRYIPPKENAENRPTTIYLCSTNSDFKKLIGGKEILNPAIYDSNNKQIICGSELKKIGEELHQFKANHQKQFQLLYEYETEIRKLYKDNKNDLDRFLATIAEQKKKILNAETANDHSFDIATRNLFSVLFHELFHAYIDSFVYPQKGLAATEQNQNKKRKELPRWLNEGLAQVFESTILEASELRIDQPDPIRVKLLRENWTPLIDVLQTKPEHFFSVKNMNNASSTLQQSEAANRKSYLTSWAIAYYLLSKSTVVRTEKFDQYLVQLLNEKDPKEAFELLVEMPVEQFEKNMLTYFSQSKPN